MDQHSLSGLLTELCAFVQLGPLSLEHHLDGELWQASATENDGRSMYCWFSIGSLGVPCFFFWDILHWSMFTVWFGDQISSLEVSEPNPLEPENSEEAAAR